MMGCAVTLGTICLPLEYPLNPLPIKYADPNRAAAALSYNGFNLANTGMLSAIFELKSGAS